MRGRKIFSLALAFASFTSVFFIFQGQPAAKSNMLIPVAGGPPVPTLMPPNLPPVPQVPPNAYGDDDAVGGAWENPRIFGIPYSICGNGILESKELCDDGNANNNDGCNILCLLPICGNGLLEQYEQCDDNNNVDGDGCTKDCLYEYCGNGRIDKLPYQVNGADAYEQCDDGNNKAGDGCSPCCLYEKCKNSILEPGEECDDTKADCSAACKIVPPAKL